jgi:DNA-binding response OmpR family regulator
MKILLIEPDKKLGDIYKRALVQAGHTVKWAAHAQDAVHSADDSKPDVIVLELQLASHNGIEFLYEFRSYAEWQTIPVILLTMVSPQSLNITREMMQAFGIVECLYKPATNLKQLVNAIEDLS